MQQHGRNKRLLLVIVFLAVLDGMAWSFILFPRASADEFALYFLDVGQGDSQLFTFPGGVQAIVDGGPANGRLLQELSEILPPHDRYIDVIILSHPQLDHFGGLIDLLAAYEVGAFITNGVRGETKAYAELTRVLEEKGIGEIVLRAGDRIRYGDYLFNIISPTPEQAANGDLNESGTVMLFTAGNEEVSPPPALRALYTADIGAKTETVLAGVHDLRAHVLKVGHHGSKFSSSVALLRAVSPRVAAIGVGKNTYGHPTEEALGRLEAAGARVFRTDRDGTVKITLQDGTIGVFTRRRITPR